MALVCTFSGSVFSDDHRHPVISYENCTCNSHFKPLDGGIDVQPNGAVETVAYKKPFHRAVFYHRHLVVYCENCTCNAPIKPLDGGIEAQPIGAVETVAFDTPSPGLLGTSRHCLIISGCSL